MQPRRHTFLAAIAATALVFALGASAGARAADERTEELKSLEDPTLLKRRVWLDSEWNKFRDHSNEVTEAFFGVWSWRVSERQEWGLRIKVPLELHFAGHDPFDSDTQGLGDIKFGTATAFRLSESWRAGVGIELRTPTAADDLGNDVWQLQETGAIAWDATRWLTFSPSFEYNQSIAEGDGVPPAHFLELFFPATILLPHRWSVSARYEAKVDFEAGNYVTQSAKFTVAKQLEDAPLNFALSFKKPFTTGAKDFQVNFVVSYFFQ